ncbi:hypothetical protein [Anaerorhabdus sp.]|uniref:hypothetical protein n=1 Tax=Anaerorhabdus sp. TaxID=1872524 RepID=UPI002FC701E2
MGINAGSSLLDLTILTTSKEKSYTFSNALDILSSTHGIPVSDLVFYSKLIQGHYKTATDKIELINSVLSDVSFEQLPISLVNSLVESFTSFAKFIVTGSCPVLPMFSTIMNFYSNLFNVAALAALSYSWSGRVAVRTAIYVGMTPRPEQLNN